MKNKFGPKVLIFDLETSYLETKIKHWDSHTNDYIYHDKMTIKEWAILAFAAKWLGDSNKNIIYHDNRKKKNKRDDKELVKKLAKHIDEADIILTKNGKRFDEKMFNARCLKYGITPPSPVKHIDVEQIVRRRFKLVSYSLDYICEFLDTEHKKLKHGEFPGMLLWDECLAGNLKAWKEMQKYNCWDVFSTEDVYNKVKAWDNSVDFNLYKGENDPVTCNCGSSNLHRRGYSVTTSGKYIRYQCQDCGSWLRDKKNLLTKNKKSLLKKKA